MKVILIEDKDCRALLNKLELTAMRNPHRFDEVASGRPPSWDSMHRAFHYEVTKWLQEMGAEGLSNR